MADLIKIKKDGTETGATAADKINASFDKVDLVSNATDNHENDMAKHLEANQNAALDSANSPSASNPIATIADIPTGGGGGTGDFLADGTVPMTGDLDMAGNEIKNLPDRETYELKGDNPNMSMHIAAGGTSAQMQVIDTATGHIVATMEYYKPDGAILIDVANPTTGAIETEFEIKPDGFVYINGSKIITEDHRTYDFVQLTNNLVVNDANWEDAMVLTTPIRQPGIYEYKWEILFTMNVVNASAKFRYSIDDGATWATLSKEVKDKTNEETINIWFPYELTTAQVVKLRVQVAKENAGNEMVCKYGSLVCQRVK